MKENKEKFKQFVIKQLKDYDKWREASPDGYAEIITDEAVKLFYQPAVMQRSELLKTFADYVQGRMWEVGNKDLSEFIEEFLSL